MEQINGTGRRKTSVSRVFMKPGSGKIEVNKRDFQEYFNSDILQTIVSQPFQVLEQEGSYDIKINVTGGGISAQAEASRMAIARALVKMNEDNKKPLKDAGYLTRDPRMVERKKPGKSKARRSPQFSKR